MFIPIGAMFWIAATVHGLSAASERTGRTGITAIAMLRIDQ
jgi:hypothetical protein